MRGGKDHARQTQSTVPNEEPRASGSNENPGSGSSSTEKATQSNITTESNTQSTGQNDQSGVSTRTSPDSSSGVYQEVLVDCNALIEAYRKGEVSKPTVYADIQSKLSKALGN